MLEKNKIKELANIFKLFIRVPATIDYIAIAFIIHNNYNL